MQAESLELEWRKCAPFSDEIHSTEYDKTHKISGKYDTWYFHVVLEGLCSQQSDNFLNNIFFL